MAAEEALKNLTGNPTPRNIEFLKNFLRDYHKQRKEERTTPSSEVSLDERKRHIGEKLVVLLSKEIGHGRSGTVVYEGYYEDRAVAVKCLPRSHIKLAEREIENLIASDHDQSIVRYHGTERDGYCTYLALELCDCNLDDLIQIWSSESSQYELLSNDSDYSTSSVSVFREDRLETIKNILGNVDLSKENTGRPSPLFLKLMREMVTGLVHLHDLGIIHRDINPRNILIKKRKSLCAKLSDMSIGKRLPEDKSSLNTNFSSCAATGWKAPEQLLHGRLTKAMDLFSLGCVLFFCITLGSHPFGEPDERDTNIVKNHRKNWSRITNSFPEAIDLISSLLKPHPNDRPKASEVLHHPLFWDSKNILNFLHDVSDKLVGNNSDFSKAIERTARTVFGTKWKNKVSAQISNHMERYAIYKYYSVRDLLRLIRNMVNHYAQLPQDIQMLVGPLYEGVNDYFTIRFPQLLIEVYKVVCTYCKEDEPLNKYFKSVANGGVHGN